MGFSVDRLFEEVFTLNKFLSVLAIHLHSNGILGAQKYKLLKMCFKVQFVMKIFLSWKNAFFCLFSFVFSHLHDLCERYCLNTKLFKNAKEILFHRCSVNVPQNYKCIVIIIVIVLGVNGP